MKKYRIIYQNSNIDAPQGTFDIGRSLDCNLVLDDPSVSRVHATILKQDDDLFIIDKGSRNGCNLNGQRVEDRKQLGDGDIIKIGQQVIKISTLSTPATQNLHAKNTMGLIKCKKCDKWISSSDGKICPSCDSSTISAPVITTPTSDSLKNIKVESEQPTTKDPSYKTIHSEQMLTGLAQKAIARNKNDEAHRLITNFFELAIKKEYSSKPLNEDSITQASLILINLASLQNDPNKISELFSHFCKLKRLISRKAVESLYNTVRDVKYLSSPQMHSYLTILAEMSRKFSPGEKFIHRRIEGLVGLCS